METFEILRLLEEKLLQPAIRKNAREVALLLTDDFVEIGSSGRVFDKRAVLAELAAKEPALPILLSDFAVEMLTPQIALATYQTTRLNESGVAPTHALRSSIWVSREGQWQIRFHQGTRIP